MKNRFFIFLLLATLNVFAQTTNVSYTTTSENFSNPERGMYHHTETHSTGYSSLSQSTLTNYRVNEKITLIVRVFYLENFRNAPISQDYLNKIQADFNAVRNAGIKIIPRFAYSDSDVAGQRDASKAQILSHISQLQPLLQNNVDVIASVQAGFIGSWGEWYYTDYFGISPTATDYANRKDVINALLAALPASRMVHMRTPVLKQKMAGTTTPIAASQAYNGSNNSRLAHHNDCFLASSTDFGTYSNISSEYPFLESETKYLAMGGETCAPNAPRTDCSTALQEMKKFHWSYLNTDYHASVLNGFISNGCMNEIKNKLGYRFELVNGTFTQSANAGSSFPLVLKINNSGWATPFNERKAYLILRNTGTNQEYAIQLASDPRLWTSQTETTINENVTLPANIVPGSYKLYLSLPDSDANLRPRPEYSVRMANTNTWESTTGYNNLNFTMNVASSTLGTQDNNVANATIFPIPANNQITVEMTNIQQYTLAMYNSLGQMVKVNTTVTATNMVINTESLSDGVYYLQFSNGTTKDSRRVIVKH